MERRHLTQMWSLGNAVAHQRPWVQSRRFWCELRSYIWERIEYLTHWHWQMNFETWCARPQQLKAPHKRYTYIHTCTHVLPKSRVTACHCQLLNCNNYFGKDYCMKSPVIQVGNGKLRYKRSRSSLLWRRRRISNYHAIGLPLKPWNLGTPDKPFWLNFIICI